ncbi:somatic embryogenesis receptor kinase 1 [Vigna unguiculata]|uniref:Somatic embryogenesis receptor kinase 1 n=1 Tax=Vigna unguiculata TaxID=3917 RepID=A0A4D6KQ66_VIGUN|nr:somatic embryogenesis receptor kinase 1 [Vigna unguiculata]
MANIATFRFLLLWTLFLCFAFTTCAAQRGPYGMHISCGARHDVQTKPTTTLWYKDFGYTGGIPTNASTTSYIAPPLKTLRYFPLSEGLSNCYNINRVPKGRYSIRIFFGLVAHTTVTDEPLFDISIQGTQIYSLKSGWTTRDDQAFTEAQVSLMDGSVSICFHGTGHGDPAILSIEILQIDDKAYYFGPDWSEGVMLRTVKRLSCGFGQSKFGVDYGADPRGGDRYWQHIKTFGGDSDQPRSVETRIKQASHPPNFYPETLYRSALVSTSSQPDLTYTLDVDPNKNYSVWLHFAEIDNSVTATGQRVFDIMINGDVAFRNVDIVKMSGDRYSALVLNRTVTVNGRTLTVTLSPIKGSFAIISAIEILEVITAESKTLSDEVMALQTLKKALGLPPRFGWNGDPCVPQQHPWTGADCRLDKSSSKWVIDGLGLGNQGLKGYLPNDISRLHNLQILNLSGNGIRGAIPSPLGTITSLQVLDLSYNFFNGSIPESLGQLTSLQRLDLSYNFFNGSIPESLGQLTSLQRLNLNGNLLSGRVPATLGGRLLHGASFNFTDNAGLCGIPGLPTCGPHLSAGAKVGIGLGASFTFLLLIIGSVCWWKRRQNILRVQQIAARAAPYAKARTQFSRDIQMARHNNNNNYGNAHTAAENGPILLSR